MTARSNMPAAALAVAVGGAIGAATRYQLWRWWPDGTGFPLTTFTINVLGCFVFGVCVGLLPDRDRGAAAVLRPFLTFGVLGGFTTFSFYAVQGVTLTPARMGVLYLILTPLVAAGAARLGMMLACVRRVGSNVQ